MRRQGILRIFTEGQLGLFVGVIYGVLAILLANGIKDLNTDLAGNLASGRSASNLFRDGLNFWWVAIVVVLIIALWKFAKLPRSRTGPLRPLSKGAKGFLFGFAHALAHVLAATTLAIGFLLLFYELDPGLAETGLKIGWISALATAVAGYVVGLSIFGLYLLLANLEDPRQHATEIFGGLASTDWKNFLRLRLDTDEKLTIFPIGVPKSPTWELKPEGTDYEPWFTPENGQSVDYALLEAPIEIEPDQQ